MSDWTRTEQALIDELSKLRVENQALRKALEEAHTHIEDMQRTQKLRNALHQQEKQP